MSMYIYRSVGTEMGYILDSWGLILSKGNIFLIFTTSRPDLGPVQPPIQWVRKNKFYRGRMAEVKNDGAVPSHTHTHTHARALTSSFSIP